MADDEVATRAPESDAQEDVAKNRAIPGDSTVDQGPASMGVRSYVTVDSTSGASPTGEITKFDDIETYVTKPADYPHSSSKLLLLLTGGTGVHSTNNQLQADRYSAEGFLVVMPDQFGGDPAPTTTTTGPPDQSPSVIEQVKLGIASVAKSFTIDMWLARHTPERVLPLLHRVIRSVKETYADALENGGGLYAVGYCFGAKYILLLGAEVGRDVVAGQRAPEQEAEEGMVRLGPAIKVGAVAHATGVVKGDLEGVRVPVCVVAVKEDPLFPDGVREAGVRVLGEKGVECEVEVYEGVPHGFAVLGDYEDGKIVESQKKAYEQMLGWLQKH